MFVKTDLLVEEPISEDAVEPGAQEAFPIDLNTAELKDFDIPQALASDRPGEVEKIRESRVIKPQMGLGRRPPSLARTSALEEEVCRTTQG